MGGKIQEAPGLVVFVSSRLPQFPVFETVGPEEALSKSDDNFWMEFLRAKGLRSRDGSKGSTVYPSA